ncbi:MAG: hypothetical protein CFK52_01800 [Chloracidobacterium sp. CP2_5A]|nr:MAG: hypothetical protein CFK52_01800 [Chloracidobacterium sp. CP2_5A]
MPTQGTLADLDLLTLTQILCFARRPAALELRHDRWQGWIYFESGQVMHATLDGLSGEPALLALLRWQSASFQVIVNIRPPSQTLGLTWAELSKLRTRLSPAS